jgi:hypothetical protein
MALSCTNLTCGYSATDDMRDRSWPLVTLRTGTRGACLVQVAAISRVGDFRPRSANGMRVLHRHRPARAEAGTCRVGEAVS